MRGAVIQPSPKPETYVNLHAWKNDEAGDSNYADADGGDPFDGWCVYVRTDAADDFHPFDISGETDFDTYEEARAFADALALKLNCEVREY